MMLLSLLAWGQNPVPEFDISSIIVAEDDTVATVEQHTDASYEQQKCWFYLTKKGWCNAQNDERNYTIAVFNNKDAQFLYNKIYTYMSRQSPSPNKDISTVPNSMVSMRMTLPKCLLGIDGSTVDVDLTFSIEVKNGKVRFNYPIINRMWLNTDFGVMRLRDGAFLEVCGKSSTFELNKIINSIIKGCFNSINNQNEEDDW